MVIQFFFNEVTYGPHRVLVICQIDVDILGNIIDRIAFLLRNLKNLTRDLTEFHLLRGLSNNKLSLSFGKILYDAEDKFTKINVVKRYRIIVRISFVIGAISVLSKKEAKKKHSTGIRKEAKRRFFEFFPNIRDTYHCALFKALLNDFINCNFHL